MYLVVLGVYVVLAVAAAWVMALLRRHRQSFLQSAVA